MHSPIYFLPIYVIPNLDLLVSLCRPCSLLFSLLQQRQPTKQLKGCYHCMAAGTRGGCCQKTGRERQPPSCFLLFFPSKPQPVSSVAHIQGSSSSVSPFSEQPYGRHQGRISMLILNPAKLMWRWTVTAPPLVNLTSKLYKVIAFHLAPRVSFSCRGTDPAL